MKNKKIMILGMGAVLVVLIGVLLALLLTPVTNMLFHGTGDDFRNAGTCTARSVNSENSPAPTDITSIVVIDSDQTSAPNVQTDSPTLAPNETATPVPTVTPDPYDTLYEMADTSMMQDIVNILLIGVDFSEERLTWNGKKEWHSDVMMVLSVNFDENRADLISLPRDTYALIPGVEGIYKLNASLNCGGGLYNRDGSVNPAGLEKVCEAAEWMLGGIPVDYYYAVTMTSLKSLVDAFGGLDYDLDLTYTIQGRSYTKGMQHMDGQAVLDYCRVRKSGNGLTSTQTGDANRVNRQKRILVAFFEQLQKENLIVRIPDILNAFDGELFTNCTPSQTAALAAFAYHLNRNDIGLYSMSGSSASLFQWNFLFTDQANRVDVIKQVYGVDVKQQSEYTIRYGRYRWASMLYDVYIDLCEPLETYVQKLIDADNLLPEFTASPMPTETAVATDAPTSTPVQTPENPPSGTPTNVPTEMPTAAPSDTPAPTGTPTPATEKISISVQLEWEDSEDQDGLRPKEVPIKLTADGKDAEKATVKEDPNVLGKWETTFENLPKTDGNGNEIRYMVEIDKTEKAYRDIKDVYTFEVKGSASKSFTIVCKHEAGSNAGNGSSDTASNSNTAAGTRFFFEETRKYTAEQRQQFEDFQTALDELRSCKKTADAEAKKASKGKSNSLNSAAVAYLNKLEEVQKLAIAVAQTFGYTKVKNFTVQFLPKDVGWKTSSPWAVNYGLDSNFNEVLVDFN